MIGDPWFIKVIICKRESRNDLIIKMLLLHIKIGEDIKYNKEVPATLEKHCFLLKWW